MKTAIYIVILVLSIIGFFIGCYKTEIRKKNLQKVNTIKSASFTGICCGLSTASLSYLLDPLFKSEAASFVVLMVLIISIWTLCAMIAKWIVKRRSE